MLIEGVVVSYHYEDYLSWFLPLNRHFFDRLVVVTGDDDEQTEKLAKFYHIVCVKTNVLKDGFNKGSAINIGLNQLSRKGWIVHIDSDIILPPRAREMVNYANLDRENVYGAFRMNCNSYEEWINYFYNPSPIHEDEIFVHLNAFPVGTLVNKTYTCEKDGDLDFGKGYCPIGYFQMWNEANGVRRIYPHNHTDAARGDVEFIVKNWPERKNRVLIP